MLIKRFAVTAFLLVNTAGCISTPYPTDTPYPKDWAAISSATAKKCPNIDGHYSDEGEWVYGDLNVTRESSSSKDGKRMRGPTLSELLFPGIQNPHSGQSVPRTHVGFVTTMPDVIAINILNNSQLQLSYPLSQGSYSCEDGYLVLTNSYRPRGSTESADITLIGSREVRLSISTDGNLVVFAAKRESGVVITPILLPIGYDIGFGPAWGRFQKRR